MIPTHVTSLLLTGQASKAVDSCPCGPNIASSQSCQSGLLKSASWCQKGRSIELADQDPPTRTDRPSELQLLHVRVYL